MRDLTKGLLGCAAVFVFFLLFTLAASLIRPIPIEWKKMFVVYKGSVYFYSDRKHIPDEKRPDDYILVHTYGRTSLLVGVFKTDDNKQEHFAYVIYDSKKDKYGGAVWVWRTGFVDYNCDGRFIEVTGDEDTTVPECYLE